MGRMAALLEEHYRRYLPTAYKAIPDKPTFFHELGEDAEQQIQDLVDAMEASDPPPPGSGFREKAGHLTMIRQNAESDVMREILPPPETQTSPQRETFPPTEEPETPEDRELAAALAEFGNATQELVEQQAPVAPTEQ
jgi:hypothetical protein